MAKINQMVFIFVKRKLNIIWPPIYLYNQKKIVQTKDTSRVCDCLLNSLVYLAFKSKDEVKE